MTDNPDPKTGPRNFVQRAVAWASAIGDYLPHRWVPMLMALIVWLVAASGNLQVIALFTDAVHPLTRLLPLIVIALTSACLFAIRPGPDSRTSLIVDAILFSLPLLIMAFRPPWSDAVRPDWWVMPIWAALLLAMYLNIPRQYWNNNRAMDRLFGVVIGCFIVAYFAMSVNPVDLSRTLGALTLFAVFLGLLMVAFSILNRWPRMSFILGAAAIASFVFFEFQHHAGYGERKPVNVDNYGSADPFALWLFDRADADYYRQNRLPYPVIVVASEGGGGYAMAHSYAFLSKMSERCNNFGQHLFAMVGVSGGQVGNTLFQSNMTARNPAQVTACSDDAPTSHVDYLTVDHLSPLLGHLLFVEIPRKLLFLGAAEKGRTRVLLDSLNTVPEGYRPVPDVAYSDHFWTYGAESGPFPYRLTGKPALVSVTANVQTGNRFVFSPFEFFSKGETNWEFFRGSGDYQRGEHVLIEPDLGSVTLASASFPWVTPSLRFTMSRRLNQYIDVPPDEVRVDGSDLTQGIVTRAVNLVDGGYFENSGAETASEIMVSIGRPDGVFLQRDRINQGSGKHWYGVNSDYPHRAFDDVSGCDNLTGSPVQNMQDDVAWSRCNMPYFVITILIRNTPQPIASGMPQSFLMDPITTLLQARTARGELAISTLEERRCGFGDGCGINQYAVGMGPPAPQIWTGMFQSLIDSSAMALPLGWNMPKPKMAELEKWVVPSDAVCAQFVGPEGEIDMGLPYAADALHPEALDLLVKRNCSHQRQIAMFFDAPSIKEALAWEP